MIIKSAICLLGFALLTSCATTTRTAQTNGRKSLEEKARARYEVRYAANVEPAPPAEGPDWTDEDIPAAGPDEEFTEMSRERDLDRNPALVPSPLLRYWASSATP